MVVVAVVGWIVTGSEKVLMRIASEREEVVGSGSVLRG